MPIDNLKKRLTLRREVLRSFGSLETTSDKSINTGIKCTNACPLGHVQTLTRQGPCLSL
jgi:hypothetical protein